MSEMYQRIHQLLDSPEEQNFELVLQLLLGIGIPADDYPLSCKLTNTGERARACLGSGLGEQIVAMDWDDCDLTRLPPYCTKFPNLHYLNLNNNYFKVISEDIQLLTNLEELHLDYNQFKKFPEALADLPSLKNLSIMANQIPDFNGLNPKWECVEYLNLSRNSFRQLADNATAWTNLRELKMSRNFLNFLPQGIEETWLSLEHLNLSWNVLQPAAIAQTVKIASLRSLGLCNNNIRSLPEDLSALQHLEHLDLSFNLLTQLPESLFELPNLKTLKLKGNLLVRDPSYASYLSQIIAKMPNVAVEVN